MVFQNWVSLPQEVAPLLTALLPEYKRPLYVNILLPQGHLLRAVIFNQSPMYNAQSVAAFL